MKKKKQLYEGKAKILFETDNENLLIQEFKDDATAFNGKKSGKIANKGYVNNQMSAQLFRVIDSYNLPTHFVEVFADNAMIVSNLDMLAIEVVVRNYAAGSLLKRMDGVKEGDKLDPPLLELFLKDDAKGDPLITDEEAISQKLCTEDELRVIRRAAFKVNAILRAFFERRQIRLVDYKLEFGRGKDGKIILADEISPDTCRFWDMETDEKLDKDRFRLDLGNVEEAYEEMRRRVFKELA